MPNGTYGGVRGRLNPPYSIGFKSRIRPVVGRIQPKARVPTARWDLKEAGCGNRLTTGKPPT